MKRSFLILLITVLLAAVLIPSTALAATGRVSVSLDDDQINIGETFAVNVEFNVSGGGIDALYATVGYDSSALRFISGGGNAAVISGGSGSIIATGEQDENSITYSLRFKALTQGISSFKITNVTIFGYKNGEEMSCADASVSISVEGTQATAAPTLPSLRTPAPKPTYDPLPTVTAVETSTSVPTDIETAQPFAYISAGGTEYLINETADLSAYLQKTSYDLSGRSVTAWSLGTRCFLLLGNDGAQLYDTADGKVMPVIMAGGGLVYMSAVQPDVKGASTETISVDGVETQAIKTDAQGLYLIYCVSYTGSEGWYFFDSSDGSLQRADAEITTIEGADKEAIDTDQTQRKSSPFLLYLFVGISVVLLIILIVIATRRR